MFIGARRRNSYIDASGKYLSDTYYMGLQQRRCLHSKQYNEEYQYLQW